MNLRFLGMDPNTDTGNCPTVWFDTDSQEFVLQGWKPGEALTTECLRTGSIPDHEAGIRLPARMTALLREACDLADGTRL